MEVLLYLDAFRRASAHSISVVIPYFPYARQDRGTRSRSNSARVVANRKPGALARDFCRHPPYAGFLTFR
jgi:ribose-phosphate pyrophosphokinase